MEHAARFIRQQEVTSPKLRDMTAALQGGTRNTVSVSFLGSEGDTVALAQQLQRLGAVFVYSRTLLRPSWFQWFLPLLGAHDPLDTEMRRTFSPERRSLQSSDRWSAFLVKKDKKMVEALKMPHLPEVSRALLAGSFTAVSEARIRAVDTELRTLVANGGQVLVHLHLLLVFIVCPALFK